MNEPKRLYCVLCKHELHKHGEDWRCTENCRCLIMGCVPRSKKYGTEPTEPEPK